jgi:anthranilate synthase component II
VILLIDNYDSFVHNLARHFRRLGVETVVVRNDAIGLDQIAAMRPQAIVLSPGPCTPREAGVSLELVQELHTKLPILGVCLGHQAIAQALGGQVMCGEPVHGQASQVTHDGNGLFAGLPNPFRVGRYHSLIVEEATLPQELIATGRTENGVLMALAHREYPVLGVQFHPESILTSHGYALLANFLRLAGIEVRTATADLESGELQPVRAVSVLPQTVTPHAWGAA